MNKVSCFSNLINRHVNRMLRLVALESAGEALSINSFAYSTNKKSNTPKKAQKKVKYEYTESYARNEPRIDLIRKSFERIITNMEFYKDNIPLSVDGFRLYNLKNWANYGPINIQQNVGEISSYCNCNCEFCYEKGARGANLPWRRMMLSLSETKTRIKYYSTKTQKGLVVATNYTLEPFTNPNCMEIIELMREADPKSWMILFTNGALLTEELISRLSKAQPILIVLSLNASTPDVWMNTMRGKSIDDAKSAFRAMELLKNYEIPTIGSYVPWPSKPMSDLIDAVRFMDKMDVVRARICLPTYTRFHDSEPPFDHNKYWVEILKAVQFIRKEVRVPVGLMPALYEIKTILPIVNGVLKNSPAEKAGIQFGDRIVAVEGQNVFTIPEIRSLLGQRARLRDTIKSTTFTLQRGNDLFDVTIPHPEDPNKTIFPYKVFARLGNTRYSNSLGIHFTDGFHLTYIAEMAEICKEYHGKKVLLIVSELIESHLLEAFAIAENILQDIKDVKLYYGKPKPKFFGGSVVIGDLWVISDIISFTKEWISNTKIRPDVVIVPSSFLSQGKRDLLGHTFMDFERELDIEFRLIHCSPISD